MGQRFHCLQRYEQPPHARMPRKSAADPLQGHPSALGTPDDRQWFTPAPGRYHGGMPSNLPWALALAAAAAIVPSTVTGPGAIPVALVAGAACYLAGRRVSSLRPSLLAFAAAAAANVAIAAAGAFLTFLVTALIAAFAVCVLPWWAGRHRRLRAEQELRERTLLTTQAQLRERSRIAADMHDLLGHDLALLSLSAGTLELTADSPATQQAAAEVRRRAAAATEKLHDIVSVLSDASPSLAPAGEPVAALVARARLSGLNVTLEHLMSDAGTPPLSAIADNAVRRVAQESLTNAAKHGGGAAVRIRLDERADPVRLDVTNTMAEAARHHGRRSGQGLPGLEELVRISGGTLAAAPALPAAGAAVPVFTVTAHIPRQAAAVRADPPAGTAEVLGNGSAGHRSAAGAGTGEASDPGDSVVSLRQRGRRLLWRTAALPLGLAAALIAVFFVLQAVTVSFTALPPDSFAQLEPGQPRTEIAHLLPSASIDRPAPMMVVPVAPEGSSCEFFQARSGVLDFSPDMYRLCFRDGLLVSLDLLKA